MPRCSTIRGWPRCTGHRDQWQGDVSDMRRLALACIQAHGRGRAKAEQTYTRIMGTGSASPQDIMGLCRGAEEQRQVRRRPWNGTRTMLKVRRMMPVPRRTWHTRACWNGSCGTAPAPDPDVAHQFPEADLAPTVMEELLLLSSARGEGVGGSHAYKWDDQPFLNLYSALLKGETADEVMVMRKGCEQPLPRWHGQLRLPGAAVVLHAQQPALWCASEGGGRPVEPGHLLLRHRGGRVREQGMGQPDPFDHNDPEFNTGHPSVSPDGRRLFFASDRPGGMGVSTSGCATTSATSGGSVQPWCTGEHTGDEMYPHITPDSILYFASTGHPGLGGMDLFYSRLRPAGPGNPFNLGYPMNTRYNDHALVPDQRQYGLLHQRPARWAGQRRHLRMHDPATDDLHQRHRGGPRHPGADEGATILLKDEQGSM